MIISSNSKSTVIISSNSNCNNNSNNYCSCNVTAMLKWPEGKVILRWEPRFPRLKTLMDFRKTS